MLRLKEWNRIIQQGIDTGEFAPEIGLNTGRAGRWTIYTELVYSRDSYKWKRVNPGIPFIPTGDEGAWDECLSLAGRPIVANGDIMIYYTGQGRKENLHGETKPTKDWPIVTGLAVMSEDGFASLEAAEEGELVIIAVYT